MEISSAARYRSTLSRCEGLDDGDLVGKTDAYAYIEISGCDAQQTKTISGTLNPEWNETFTFKIDKPMSKELKIKVTVTPIVAA